MRLRHQLNIVTLFEFSNYFIPSICVLCKYFVQKCTIEQAELLLEYFNFEYFDIQIVTFLGVGETRNGSW